MAVLKPNAFVVAVDTNRYAGNFEREMVAFMTGQIGECGVGDAEADEAKEALKNLDWFEEHTVQVADDNACERPASIWPTPERLLDAPASRPMYNSVAYFVDEVPPREVLAELTTRAQDYCTENGIEYRGLRLLKAQYREVVIQEVSGHVELALEPTA